MKLGFWNRLAIVVGGLSVLIIPSYVTISTGIEHERTKELLFEDCQKLVQQNFLNKTLPPKATLQTELQKCWDWRFPKGGDGRSDSNIWRQTAIATAIVFAVIYLLIFAISATARWVWRGRASKGE